MNARQAKLAAKATNTDTASMASTMQFGAAMGHPCGYDFNAAIFLKEHPEYKWMKDILRDMPSRPWTVFNSGMR